MYKILRIFFVVFNYAIIKFNFNNKYIDTHYQNNRIENGEFK